MSYNKRWDLDTRFRYRVDQIRSTADECWIWQWSKTNKNYGLIRADGKTHSIHRLAYETFVGPLLDGMVIDHTCHNEDITCVAGNSCFHRLCVNPSHLQQITAVENTKLGHGHPGKRQTHCKHGHEFTDDNTWRDKRGVRYCNACALARYHRSGKTTRASRMKH